MDLNNEPSISRWKKSETTSIKGKPVMELHNPGITELFNSKDF